MSKFMSNFKDYSAMHTQSVCILTSNFMTQPNSCTISSFSPISSDKNNDFFSFSLSDSGFMATTITLGTVVRISLLTELQEEAARYFVLNRKDGPIHNLNEVWQNSIGYITSDVISEYRIGKSILYIAKSQNIVFHNKNKIPLVYRIRKYGLV